jgi:kynurenine formamidase
MLGNNVMILENLTGIGNIGKTRCWTIGSFPNIKGASGVYIRLLAVVNK